MKLPIFKRIVREDIKDAPDWVANLIYPINQVFETVYNTLNRGVTFQDNFLGFQKTFQFQTKPTYTSGDWDVIRLAIPDFFKVRISGAWIVKGGPVNTSQIKNISGLYLSWSQGNGTIDIDWLGGLEDDTQYSFTVQVL